ncbi:MAG: serine/threonine-protein kinase [Gemmatimonadales bacterium]
MEDLADTLRRALADRYAVEREVGRGGMAVVFRAEDLKHGRPVAIKAFRPPFADPTATSRFLQEIRVVATLAHPHILALHDSGSVDGVLFFVTPFIDGETLRDRLEREGPLPEQEALRIAATVARALDHAHRRGIVHRDVKPENILLQDGEPLLADFGIAFPFVAGRSPGARITDGGFRIGTPAYMSPEQLDGGAVDGRSDLYALGVVLYEMLGGRSPFEARTPESLLAAQVSGVPVPIATLRTGLSETTCDAVERALAQDPVDRWQSGNDFAAALGHAPGKRLRWRSMAWATGLGLLAIGIAVVGLTRAHAPAPPPRAVLLADFHGPSVDPALVRTMRELVAVALGQSRVVTLLAPDQLTAVRRAAGVADTATLTVGLARELAERAGLGAMVTGELFPAASGYSLVLQAVRVQDGAALVSVSEHADDASGLVGAAERGARDLRAGLGERAEDLAATRPLLDVATRSMPAFRKYADALERSRIGDPVGSNVLLREAVAIDTGFASAWALMAVNFMDLRLLDSGAVALREALARPGRLTDAQRYRLQADAAYTIADDPVSGVRWYDLYLQEVPGSIGGRNNRALYLTMLGRWQEARDEFLHAAADDPRGPTAAPMMRLNALASAVALGQVAVAAREAKALDGPFRAYAELLLAAAEGRWSNGDSLAQQVLADASTPAWLKMQAISTRASAASMAGRPDDADRILQRAHDAEQGAVARWYAQARIVLALARGARLPMPTSDPTPGGWVLSGTAAGWDGDATTARQALRRLTALDSLARRRLGAGVTLVRAALDGATGAWGRAASLLAEPARIGELDAFALDRPSTNLLCWAEARAWLAAGDSAAAARALAPLRTSAGLPPNQVALLGLGQPFAEPILHSHP